MSKLITTWFGVFLVERGKVKEQVLFPKDAKEIATRLKAISEGQVLEEEKGMAKGVKVMKVSEVRQADLGQVSRAPSDRELASMPERFGFPRSLLQEAMLKLGRERMKEVAEDRYIIQAVKAIDDLNRTANLLSERLHEWYSFHFPELGRDIPDERYASVIATLGDREKVAKDVGYDDISSSVGAELGQDDREAIMSYASALDTVYSTRKRMERYIEDRMGAVAPNITHLTGAVIGARLIALAGGLDRLARLPSSTVQMLGAEKAFFKHLTEGADMPKHGVIFQHPIIHASSHWQRGKIARAFASKIAIAAKADSYSDRFLAGDLKKDLDARVARVKKTFRNPPRSKNRDMAKGKRSPRGKGRSGPGRKHKGH